MAKIEMYSTAWCPFCVRAKQLLAKLDLPFEDTDVDQYPQARATMMQRGGGRTVPQIFINDQPVGGCDELFALQRSGQLQQLISE